MRQYSEIEFEESEAVDVISTAKTTYSTLYVVIIKQFPFDGTTECNVGSCSGELLR
jgi:hypothetical protein